MGEFTFHTGVNEEPLKIHVDWSDSNNIKQGAVVELYIDELNRKLIIKANSCLLTEIKPNE